MGGGGERKGLPPSSKRYEGLAKRVLWLKKSFNDVAPTELKSKYGVGRSKHAP